MYYVIIFKGIAPIDVVYLCNLIGMHNLADRGAYIKIWLTDEKQLGKLRRVLLDLDVDFDIAKRLDFDE